MKAATTKRLLERAREAPRSAHALVTRSIGIDILTGRLAPGSPLPGEEELLRRFRISRTALREALKTLAAKGVIQSKTRVGTTVQPVGSWNMFDPDLMAWRLEAGVDLGFMRNLFEIRFAIEPAAAALAALRRSETDLEILEGILDEMAASADRETFVAFDLAFHKAILSASANPLMQSIGSVIEAALVAALRRSAPADDPKRLVNAVEEHRAIFQAIVTRDQDAARAAMTAVIKIGAQNGGIGGE